MLRLSLSVVMLLVLASACNTDTGSATAPRATSVSAARGQPSPTNVTSTIADGDASGALLLTRSDDFNASGSASYTSVSGVSSVITADGSAWQLYLGSQSVRKLYLVLAGQGAPFPDGYYSSSVEAYSQCFDQSNNATKLLSMTAGETNGNCSFGVDFDVARTTYKLVMSPKFAGTGRAAVTCTAAASGQCTRWAIEPNVVAPNAGVANLYHFGRQGALVLDGTYHNSYSVVAAR